MYVCFVRVLHVRYFSQADEIKKKHPHDKILNAVHALEDDQQAKRHMMCVMLHRRCVQPFLSVLIIENRLEQASAVGFVCLRVFHDALPAQPSPLFPSHSYHRKAVKHAHNANDRAQRLIKLVRVFGFILFVSLTGSTESEFLIILPPLCSNKPHLYSSEVSLTLVAYVSLFTSNVCYT